VVAQLIKDRLGYKYHWALADYLQRSARHLASRPTSTRPCAGQVAAVDLALRGKSAVMATIERLADAPYRWEIGDADLGYRQCRAQDAGEFISADGFQITDACRTYLQPLIEGEDPPPYRNGLPDYVRLKERYRGKEAGGVQQAAGLADGIGFLIGAVLSGAPASSA
jgi:hypothetical protein